MDFTEFFNQQQEETTWLTAFQRTVLQQFEGECPRFEHPENIYALIRGGKDSSSLSKSKFFRNKKMTLAFYKWLQDKQLVDESTVEYIASLALSDVVSEDAIQRYYYKSLDEVLGFVKLVGDVKDMGGYRDLLFIKSLAILLWNDVELDEMTKIKKDDLCVAKGSVKVGLRDIELEEKYFDILREYASADSYKSYPSGYIQHYLPSDSLFRSNKQTEMTVLAMRTAIHKFNAFMSREYGKELSAFTLRRNGVFDRIYKSGSRSGANSHLMALTGCSSGSASVANDLYEAWIKLMKEGDE